MTTKSCQLSRISAAPKESEVLLSAQDLTEVLNRVADGEPLRDVCADPRLPNVDEVNRALIHDSECFQLYLNAQRLRTLADIDQLQSIAEGNDRVLVREEQSVDPDTGAPITTQHFAQEDIQRSKLKVDTIKWRAERLFPAVYGNRVEHDHVVKGELATMLTHAMNKGHVLPNSGGK